MVRYLGHNCSFGTVWFTNLVTCPLPAAKGFVDVSFLQLRKLASVYLLNGVHHGLRKTATEKCGVSGRAVPVL